MQIKTRLKASRNSLSMIDCRIATFSARAGGKKRRRAPHTFHHPRRACFPRRDPRGDTASSKPVLSSLFPPSRQLAGRFCARAGMQHYLVREMRLRMQSGTCVGAGVSRFESDPPIIDYFSL